MEEELLRLEHEFGRAMIQNDADAIGRFLGDDWIIIDPEGGIIDRTRFRDVITSGALSHEAMDPHDIRVRIYGNTAIVTALTLSRLRAKTFLWGRFRNMYRGAKPCRHPCRSLPYGPFSQAKSRRLKQNGTAHSC